MVASDVFGAWAFASIPAAILSAAARIGRLWERAVPSTVWTATLLVAYLVVCGTVVGHRSEPRGWSWPLFWIIPFVTTIVAESIIVCAVERHHQRALVGFFVASLVGAVVFGGFLIPHWP